MVKSHTYIAIPPGATIKEQLQDRIGDFLKYVGLSLKDIFSLSLSINVKLLSYSSDNSLLSVIQ